jgi:N-acyl-L-homoserine lactone synthetase
MRESWRFTPKERSEGDQYDGEAAHYLALLIGGNMLDAGCERASSTPSHRCPKLSSSTMPAFCR